MPALCRNVFFGLFLFSLLVLGPGIFPARALLERSPRAGDVPDSGPSSWRKLPLDSEQIGSGGRLIRLNARVERGLTYSPRAISGKLRETLFDLRGWLSDGRWDFRLVTQNQADFTFYFASPGTVDQLCAPLDTEGKFSCRQNGRIVINFWRWHRGASTFESIVEYRRYLINHELGHALGFIHHHCEKAGSSSPIMVQQTISLEGCLANGWPYPENVKSPFVIRLLDRFVKVGGNSTPVVARNLSDWLDYVATRVSVGYGKLNEQNFDRLVERSIITHPDHQKPTLGLLYNRYEGRNRSFQRVGLLLELEARGVVSFGSEKHRQRILGNLIASDPFKLYREDYIWYWWRGLPPSPYSGPYRKIVTGT